MWRHANEPRSARPGLDRGARSDVSSEAEQIAGAESDGEAELTERDPARFEQSVEVFERQPAAVAGDEPDAEQPAGFDFDSLTGDETLSQLERTGRVPDFEAGAPLAAPEELDSDKLVCGRGVKFGAHASIVRLHRG